MREVRAALEELRAAGLLRELRTIESAPGPHVRLDGRDVLLLCSNDYLGLAGDPRVRAAAAEAAQRWGAGAGSSRLVSGGLTIHDALEEELADHLGTETALLVGSGYLANLAAVTALTEPGDVIHSDALNHASIVDACRLSRAETVVYDHLTVPEGAQTIVTDAVFSMDGDVAPLAALRATGARLIVDGAHHTGVIRGRIDADVVIGTLSKALGSYGAFIGCDRETRSLLVNRARPIIYSTALPPAAVGAARAALDILRTEPQRMERLHASARALREGLGAPVSDMPIVPLIVGDPEDAMAVTAQALEKGVFAQAIRPPTVPDGTSRLRLVARADHEPDELRAAGAMLAACASSARTRRSPSAGSTA
jgi:8-amino-7-oxononanoate synthase